jgi:hypothetical protein
VKFFAALLAGLALAGCGEATRETAVPASSGPTEPSGVTETSSGAAETSTGVTETSTPPVRPPEIVLASAAGKQIALLGSYCVTATDESTGQSQGLCADSMWPHPKRVSVVHPGDSVSVVLSDANVRKDGSVTVLPLGCEHTVVKTIPLTPGQQSTAFAVDLDPGAYELQVFAPFKAAASSGDVSGALGLVVAPDAPATIDAGPPRRSGC